MKDNNSNDTHNCTYIEISIDKILIINNNSYQY